MNHSDSSPRWNTSIKLVVALTLVAIAAGLLIKFQGVLPPLIIVVILAYLFNPAADILSRRLHIPWTVSVTLIYAVLVLVLLGLLTLGGVGVVQQVQNLITLIQNSIQNIPSLLQDISGREIAGCPQGQPEKQRPQNSGHRWSRKHLQR